MGRERMPKIGFIGLGIMGNAMARNLLKSGRSLVVYDVVPALTEALVQAGAGGAASCREVASRFDVVILMLPDGPEVEQAVLGPAGVLEGLQTGAMVVDRAYRSNKAITEPCDGLDKAGIIR